MPQESFEFAKAKIRTARRQQARRRAITAVAVAAGGTTLTFTNHDPIRALIFAALVGTLAWHLADPTINPSSSSRLSEQPKPPPL